MRRTREEAEATRSQLRDAALEVFAERGYSAARLEEIAERAGVTRGALYHHYAGKSELYAAAVGELWQEITGPIFELLDGDGFPLERLERFVAAYIAAIDRDPRFRALLTVNLMKTEVLPELAAGLAAKERALGAWVEHLRDLFAEARRAGELAEGLRPADAARATVCFVNGVATTVTIAPGVVDPGRHARSLAAVLTRGLRA
jgi:TetR/AcrR family transcriptional regulator, acrAB operon repressor